MGVKIGVKLCVILRATGFFIYKKSQKIDPPTKNQKAKLYKVNAKLIEKLFKSYAKFNAKYVRSPLDSAQNK